LAPELARRVIYPLSSPFPIGSVQEEEEAPPPPSPSNDKRVLLVLDTNVLLDDANFTRPTHSATVWNTARWDQLERDRLLSSRAYIPQVPTQMQAPPLPCAMALGGWSQPSLCMRGGVIFNACLRQSLLATTEAGAHRGAGGL
jgi:hypothetical protein